MRLDTRDVLADAYGRIRQTVHRAADGLDAAGLAFRPEPEANSVAWLVWHLTRIQDDHIADIAGHDQTWIGEGWHQWLAFALAPTDTGFGHTTEQVDLVRPDSADVLLAYHDAVAERTQTYLATVEPGELARVIDASYDPPTTVGVRLVSVLSDNLQHAGQASYVRGILDRRC